MADDGRTTLVKLRAGSLFEDPRGTRWCLVADAVPSRAAAHLPAVCLDRTGRNNLPPDLRVRPLNLPALLKELHEMRTLAHDLLLDRDAAYGREVGRGEAVALLEEEAQKWADPGAPPSHQNEYDWSLIAQTYHRAAQQVRALGPARPLPPPERLAARCRALEDALRAVVSAWDDPGAPLGPIDAARKLLEEISAGK